jgi:hypothetical protein
MGGTVEIAVEDPPELVPVRGGELLYRNPTRPLPIIAKPFIFLTLWIKERKGRAAVAGVMQNEQFF